MPPSGPPSQVWSDRATFGSSLSGIDMRAPKPSAASVAWVAEALSKLGADGSWLPELWAGFESAMQVLGGFYFDGTETDARLAVHRNSGFDQLAHPRELQERGIQKSSSNPTCKPKPQHPCSSFVCRAKTLHVRWRLDLCTSLRWRKLSRGSLPRDLFY